MKKKLIALAAFSAIAFSITGCANNEVDLGTPENSNFSCETGGQVVDLINVNPDLQQAPNISFPSPLKSNDTEFRFITEGSGPHIVANQTISTRLSIYNGADGSILYDGNHTDISTSPLFLLVNKETLADSQFSNVFGPILCAPEGSRIAVTAPADQVFEPEIIASYNLQENDSIVYLIDVVGAFLPQANGADQIVTNNNLPSATFAQDGTPGLTFRGNAAPTELTVEQLKAGHGQVVAADSNVVMHFSTWSWNDKRVIDTTWTTKSPGQIVLGTNSNPLLPDETLIGQKVGSQLMVVTPSEDGKDAKVLVVDILGIFQ